MQPALITKYIAAKQRGISLFAVTLSTYVKSDAFAHSDLMRLFWDFHFIYRVRKCLPVRAKLDHDWVVEQTAQGAYHFHGILAVESVHEKKIWLHGALRPKLRRALESFADSGRYRPLRINKFEIEPINDVEKWCRYITKQSLPFSDVALIPRFAGLMAGGFHARRV